MKPYRNILVLLLSIGISSSYGQDTGQSALENVYARPGRATMVIYVGGDVALAGRWRVETDAELLDVLAVAGPTEIVVENNPTIQKVGVQVYRGSNGGRSLVFDEPFQSLLTSSSASLRLEEGDFIVVDIVEREESTSIGVTEVLTIASGVASLVLAAITIATR